MVEKILDIGDLKCHTIDWDWWPSHLVMVGYPEYLLKYVQGQCDLEMLKKKVQFLHFQTAKKIPVEDIVEEFREQLEGALF
jgi:hypothetical protein